MFLKIQENDSQMTAHLARRLFETDPDGSFVALLRARSTGSEYMMELPNEKNLVDEVHDIERQGLLNLSESRQWDILRNSNQQLITTFVRQPMLFIRSMYRDREFSFRPRYPVHLHALTEEAVLNLVADENDVDPESEAAWIIEQEDNLQTFTVDNDTTPGMVSRGDD